MDALNWIQREYYSENNLSRDNLQRKEWSALLATSQKIEEYFIGAVRIHDYHQDEVIVNFSNIKFIGKDS